MMLRNRMIKLRDALVNMSDVMVFHYWRPNLNPPFILWQEDGEESSFDADNRKIAQGIHGTIDFYTKEEYDPVFDLIQSTLNNLDEFGWRYEATLYEEETNLIHHSFDWWVRNGNF